jgi:hypothetical protein
MLGFGGPVRRPIVKGMDASAADNEPYPVDGNGFVRQCAWCKRIADAEGRYRLVSNKLFYGASHGCCEACAIRFLSRAGIRRAA